MKRRAIALAAILSFAMVASCGGGGGGGSGGDGDADSTASAARTAAPDGDPSADVKACELLTPAEIGSRFGVTVGEGKPDVTSYPGPDCTWAWGQGFSQVFLSISSLEGMQPQAWVDANKRSFERQGQNSVPEDKRTTFVQIDGVGDAAWGDQRNADGSMQQVHAAHDGTSIGLSFTMPNRPSKDTATQLLTLALDRLEG